MNRETIVNRIGLGLMALCFIASCLSVVFRTAPLQDPGLITLRFAHWQLEGGVRDALDAVAREFEKECAQRGQKVKVVQMAIPEAVYPNWFITQLVGSTAPDLLEIGKGDSDDRKARYFRPLTFALEQPNPYNKGNEFENVPWRDTFSGGLTSVYSQTLLEYYQIPVTVFTVRMFYNLDLYKKIAGDAPTPSTYAELRDLCLKVQQYAQLHNPSMLPIAGSRYNSPYVTDLLMASQTQRLAENINLNGNLYCDQEQVGLAYLRGGWNLSSPEVSSGLRLVQDVSRFMQPGYLQLAREDATFYFVQGDALMLSTGSWDATSILQQAPFAVGVFKIPLPSTDAPEFGKFVQGRLSEAGSGISVNFGLYRDSAHTDLALDFLRFLSSKRGAKIFTDTSGWLPVTRNVEPDERVKQFEPTLDGYIQGFALGVGGNTQRIYDNNFYRLLNQPGGLDDFIESARPDYSQAVVDDLKSLDKGRLNNLSRSDTTLAAIWRETLAAPQDASLQRKLHELTELQGNQELSSAFLQYSLAKAALH